MTRTATAAVVWDTDREFELTEVTLDAPRPDEVVVRLVAAGVCGTDLHVQAGHVPFPLPGVLGHEGAGVVEEVGSAVRSVAPGDHVLLSFTSCGACANCAAGDPAYCDTFLPRNLLGGKRMDGSATVRRGDADLHAHFFGQSSFSTRCLADERSVTKVDPDVDLASLAPLGCGVQTGAGAVLNVLRPEPGSTLAVFGAGAVGLSAVMAAALSGTTTVVAVDVVPQRLELARELGATHVVDSRSADPGERLAALTDGRGVEYAIDATGITAVLETALGALAPGGTCAAIGAPPAGQTVAVDVNFLLNGRRLVGITEGDANPQLFLPALVELVRQGRLPVERMIRRYPFAEINAAAAAQRDGSVLKPVLTFED
jgi:aryl-alcohol dehydrogenase